jgi:hypothetical protein
VGAAADFISGHKQGDVKKPKTGHLRRRKKPAARLVCRPTAGLDLAGHRDLPLGLTSRGFAMFAHWFLLRWIYFLVFYDGFALVWVGFLFVFHMAPVTFKVIKWLRFYDGKIPKRLIFPSMFYI